MESTRLSALGALPIENLSSAEALAFDLAYVGLVDGGISALGSRLSALGSQIWITHMDLGSQIWISALRYESIFGHRKPGAETADCRQDSRQQCNVAAHAVRAAEINVSDQTLKHGE